MIYGTLQEVPFVVTAEYGWPLKRFTWNFFSLNNGEFTEKLITNESSSLATITTTDKSEQPITKTTESTFDTIDGNMQEQTLTTIIEMSELTDTNMAKLETNTESIVTQKWTTKAIFNFIISDISYMEYTSAAIVCKCSVIAIVLMSLALFC